MTSEAVSTDAHTDIRRQLHNLRARQRQLAARQALFEHDRLALFNMARSLDPPMTWAEIAGIMEVTEAGIANLVKRNQGRHQ